MTSSARAVHSFEEVHRPMRARAVDEAHRTATPLELLFDLTFVVAVAQAASGLAHAIEAGHALTAIGPFLMVFFAIWWAWMNFTWFASAYDSDDVPYRIAAFVQMAGVLVLAAGIGPAFDHGDYTAVTVGYVIMRLGLLSLWLRAAHQHPSSRRSSLRYATGVAALEMLWVARLALPERAATTTFLVLAVMELSVPIWAERRGATTWHPHHIAERYGLFTLIILGESVFAATNAVAAVIEDSAGIDLAVISFAGLLIIAAVWWLYFLVPAGSGLEERRRWAFVWGYGHYLVYAALAALGAGLEVVVAATMGDGSHLDSTVVVASVSGPLALIVVMLGALHVPILGLPPWRPAAIMAVVGLVTITAVADVLGPTVSMALVAVVICALVTADLTSVRFGARRISS
jgi:low temperature requirement protein LtrA